MELSRENLKNITSNEVAVPGENLFSLPEKVLQFGTGVLLRGLPDYFIDKANRNGVFNGRIVVVKSTSKGETDEFDRQDNLYTLCMRGIENNKRIQECIINSSISRVLLANDSWDQVLHCAQNPELKIIISNTTEIGIELTDDNVNLLPPRSFPGKLLSFLLARYMAFQGSTQGGLVIIPTELITDNGTKLRSIVLELAKMNKLDDDFVDWVKTSNHFCNSLVDRIVPGKLEAVDRAETEAMLGYTDNLMIMCESFRLWAIESESEHVRQILSFAGIDEGVVIAPDIEKFRELKLRLLNGTHSFTCGLAFLGGFKTVREAMSDRSVNSFVHNLAINEIAGAMDQRKISYDEALNFASKVINRFRNPFIDHHWLNISVQYSSKMKMRNIPLLIEHYRKHAWVPEHMALGFAGYILFMKCTRDNKGNFGGVLNGSLYPVEDKQAPYFSEKWKCNNANDVVDGVLADAELWETDLSLLPGFAESVKTSLQSLIERGVTATMAGLSLNKTEV